MVLAEVAEAETVEMALVGGVAKGAEIGVVRSLDTHRPARAHQSVKLLHSANHVVYVFDDVDGCEAVERPVREGIREAVEVCQNIGAAGGIPIDSNGTGLLVNPAANVEHFHSFAVAA